MGLVFGALEARGLAVFWANRPVGGQANTNMITILIIVVIIIIIMMMMIQ